MLRLRHSIYVHVARSDLISIGLEVVELIIQGIDKLVSLGHSLSGSSSVLRFRLLGEDAGISKQGVVELFIHTLFKLYFF